MFTLSAIRVLNGYTILLHVHFFLYHFIRISHPDFIHILFGTVGNFGVDNIILNKVLLV